MKTKNSKFKIRFQRLSSLADNYSFFGIMISTFFILTFVFVSYASASYVKLNTTLVSKIKEDDLSVSISSMNKGDESAFNVQAELIIEGQKMFAEKAAEVNINGTYKLQNNFKLRMKKKGVYPLTVVMHYTDANQYPFSALICQTYEYGKVTASPILGQLKSVSLSNKGSINLALKNAGDTMINAKTYMIIPGELTNEEKEKEISIPSGAEKKVSFTIKNFSALAESTYQVFAITEFDTKDEHQTIISSGIIKVVASHEILGINYIIIFSVLIILILIFIAVQFKRN